MAHVCYGPQLSAVVLWMKLYSRTPSLNDPDVGSQTSYDMTDVTQSGCAVRGSMGSGWIMFAGLAPFAPGWDPSVLYFSTQCECRRNLLLVRNEYERAKIINKRSYGTGIAPMICKKAAKEWLVGNVETRAH
jgi:hypothetical protein